MNELLFWAKVAKGDGCWEWTGSRDHKGYGCFSIRGHQNRAHRVVWTLTNGPIPDGMCICHHCDNPPCVRPDHLFLGTKADNYHDMAAKGREVLGSARSQAKLTEDAVVIIRQQLSEGATRASLARRFGVDPGVIRQIIRGETWKHVA